MIYLISLLATFINSASTGYDLNAVIVGNEFFNEFDGNLRYSHCDDASESSIKLEMLKTYPSQYDVPGNISMLVDFSILKTLWAPITFDVTVSKDIPLLGYITLPCIANFGSCTFNKACHILDTYPKDSLEYRMTCPKWLRDTGVECKCPIKKGRYKAKDVIAVIENSLVPKWIAAGDYKVMLKIREGDKMAGCFKFQFRLK